MNTIIEDFLMQFPTIFGDGLPDGVHVVVDNFNWENSGVFDRDGNRLTEADTPWVLYGLYATEFTLWDFDNDGMPDIRIEYSGNDDSGVMHSLFRFIDGEYRRVRIPNEWNNSGFSYYWGDGFYHTYYLDSEGNLIEHGVTSVGTWYNAITFDGRVATYNMLASTDFDATPRVDAPIPHYLPGTSNWLIPIQPLTALQSQIETNVRQRLG